MINTRLFWRTLAVLFVIESAFLLAGCGNWESQAIQIIQLINPAVVAVLNILTALGVSVSPAFLTAYTNWSQQAQKGLADVATLIQQASQAAASAQGGIVSQVQAVLESIVSDLNTILPDLHVDDSKSQAAVAAALNAIVGFFGTLIALLPQLQAAKTKEDMISLHSASVDARNQFKKDFNKAVSTFGPEYELQ